MAHNSTEGERVGKWSDSGALNSGWLGYTGHQRQAELFIKKAFTNRIYVFACIHVKQTYKVSITSTNTWSSGFLSLFIQLDTTNPNDIIHNKIYFVCMGVCACMWSFVCLCVQLARSETKVKGLRRFPLYLWDSPPVNPELTNLVTVWLEATSVLPHPADTLYGCWDLDSGPHASNPPYPLRHPPAQVTYFWNFM